MMSEFLRTTESGFLLARMSSISSRLSYAFALDAAAGGAEGLPILLDRLASESGHVELIDAPLLFWGHSGGAQFGPTFAAMHPERTIGFVAYQAWVVRSRDLKTLSHIPALFFTDREGVTTSITDGSVWRSGRSAGAPWTLAPQRDAPHGDLEYLKRAHNLTIPWMRAVLRQRLLADGRTLQTVNASSGWLADDRTGEIGSFSAFSGTKEEASWLPDEQSAKGWQVVVKETK